MSRHQQARCDGSALPSVLAVLLLCGLGVMLSWQSIWRNEWSLQARADVLRTQLMADALLLMALRDVLNTDEINLNSCHATAWVTQSKHTYFFLPTRLSFWFCAKGWAQMHAEKVCAHPHNLCLRAQAIGKAD